MQTILLFVCETVMGLQLILNKLKIYCNEWGLTVNTDKTKTVIFRNQGRVTKHEHWDYWGNVIETVDSFNYLVLIFNYNGKFTNSYKQLASQGHKALISLRRLYKN